MITGIIAIITGIMCFCLGVLLSCRRFWKVIYCIIKQSPQSQIRARVVRVNPLEAPDSCEIMVLVRSGNGPKRIIPTKTLQAIGADFVGAIIDLHTFYYKNLCISAFGSTGIKVVENDNPRLTTTFPFSSRLLS